MSHDVLGDWYVSIGGRNNPLRKLALEPDGRVVSYHGREALWCISADTLLLCDRNRSILSIFALAGPRPACLAGQVRELEFADSPTWLIRKLPPTVGQDGRHLPLMMGPLQNAIVSHDQFAAAWDSGEDFSIVLYEGGEGLKAKRLSSTSINLGSTGESKRFIEFMSSRAPSSFYCFPVFCHVLNDCWLIDGSVVVTRDGQVVNETTQFFWLEPRWDEDLALRNSTPYVHESLVNVSSPTSAVIEADCMLFSSLKIGYGHWMGQSLPNWIFVDWVRQANPKLADSLVLAILSGIEREDFRLEALKLLEASNPVLPTPKGVVHCRRLMVPSFHRFHAAHWPGIGGVFRKMADNAQKRFSGEPFSRLIYSSRSGQSRGFNQNSAIEDLLKKRGFKPLVGGTMPYVQQVAAYAGADVVFGPLGSNMVNISFCKPDTKIIEVFDELREDMIWDYFLANAANLDYSVILTAVDKSDRDRGFQERRLDLQPDILEQVLSASL